MEIIETIFSFIRTGMQVICVLGMWNVFLKFGQKGWWALLPVNLYKLGECVHREKDGFYMMLFKLTGNIILIAEYFFQEDSDIYIILSLVGMAVYVPATIFSVRIYMGLCDAFGKRRRWTILWFLSFTQWYCYLRFGFDRSFRPGEEYLPQDTDSVTGTSGVTVVGNGNDLSVNIRSRSVSSFFKKFTLLRDLHLTVPTGHMVLLLGGSGAGKTTFLNAVTGYEKADADIELGKWNVYRDYNKMKYDIGFVPQQDLMRESDTVYRTIADAASLRLTVGMTGAEKKKRIDEVLDIFGLAALKGSIVSKLSGGQRKRLSIAIEYISYPMLFILDEPDSGLDGIVARNLFLKLREIADTGKIVMVITHTPERVIDLFDDVIVLAKDHARTGRLAYYGPVKEAYDFFGKDSIEDILLSINQKEEGGEGRAEEYVAKFNTQFKAAGGEA